MPKYTSRNVSDTYFHAFLAFGSISTHFNHITVLVQWTGSFLGGPTQRTMLFKSL